MHSRHSTLLGYSSPLFTCMQTSVFDRLEQCYRHAQQMVRPFRYWNFLRVLKVTHNCLAVYGLVLFWITNRCISHHDGHGKQEAVASGFILRKSPLTWNQAGHQLAWLLYTALLGGFPLYAVRHPFGDGWVRNWAHPMLYWFFFLYLQVRLVNLACRAHRPFCDGSKEQSASLPIVPCYLSTISKRTYRRIPEPTVPTPVELDSTRISLFRKPSMRQGCEDKQSMGCTGRVRSGSPRRR